MNIDELKDRKAKLERELEEQIGRLLTEFCSETGQSPSDVVFQTTEGTSFGEPRSVEWRARVWVELKL